MPRRLRTPLAAVCAAAAVLLVAGHPAAAAPRPGAVGAGGASGDLLWVGGAETGDLSQFADNPANLVGGSPPEVVTGPVREGRYAIALSLGGETTPADGICCGSRNELVPLFRGLEEGDDLFFGFSTFLGPGFPVDSGWQVITQFKQNFDGSPPLSLNVEGGEFRVEGGFGHPDGPDPFNVVVGRAGTGVWVDWVLHVRFSSDPAVGFVEVWRDGELVLPRYAPTSGTLYPGAGERAGSYVKTGYYREPDISVPGTVYFDAWRIGTTRDAVDRGLASLGAHAPL